MNKPFNLKSLVFIGGHLLFAILFFYSFAFWKERQAFDAAHYLLEIILRKSFFIAHFRPIGFVSQVLPVFGVWLNAPLKWLMILYSVGDVLYYYLIFLLLLFYFKNERATIWFFVIYLSTLAYSFYCPVTELLQGLALLPVVFCLLERDGVASQIWIYIVTLLIIFSHPLLFIPLGALLAFSFFRSKLEKKQLFLTLWFVALLAVKFLTLDIYDSQKAFYPVVYNDYGNLNNITDGGYLISFFKMLLINYPVLFFLFGWSCLILVRKKDLRLLIVYLGSVLGFLLIIICTHHFEHISNYSERMLLPLPCLIALPIGLIRSSKSENNIQLFSFLLLFGFFIFRLTQIYQAGQEFVLRNEQMKRIIDVSRLMGSQKVIADENLLEQPPIANTGWCYSIESMLLSAVEGPEKVVSIAMLHEHMDRIKQQGNEVSNKQWIKWTEFILPDDSLPSNYFSFKKQMYIPLLNDSVSSELPGNVSLKINNASLQLFHNEAFIDISFLIKDSLMFLPKSTAIRIRYNDKETLFYLYNPIANNVPQRIPLPDSSVSVNDIQLDLIKTD
jgi:hypothetical protein